METDRILLLDRFGAEIDPADISKPKKGKIGWKIVPDYWVEDGAPFEGIRVEVRD